MFDTNDNSFCALMLQSDWTRFRTQMAWSLLNPYTMTTTMSTAMFPSQTPINSSFIASGWSIAKTYPSTPTSEAISVGRQQPDFQVRWIYVCHHHRNRHCLFFLLHKPIFSCSSCFVGYYHATLCIAQSSSLYICLSVRPSVCHTRGLCPHVSTYKIIISPPYGSPMILVFWRQISSPHSNGMTFKFKVIYK